ncbi:MAG: cyclic nucleotide-binding domain-containing protein, partial [Pseudomonadota bacterium]
VGVGFYLGSYALLQFGLIRGAGYVYTIMNLIAAAFVAVSLIEAFNLSSLLIQVSWITISIFGICRRIYLDRISDLSLEDAKFHQVALPGLSRQDIGKLLRHGRWQYVEAGATLTTEGTPVDNLIFLRSGSATVLQNDHEVAVIGPDQFIGEMTCLTGDPATATVIAQTSLRCLMIPASSVRALARKNGEVHGQLERSFAADLRRKLRASANRVRTMTGSGALA